MPISTGMLASDFDAMAADMPCSLTAIGGTALATAITGTRSEIGKENDVDDSGIVNEHDLVAVFDINDFTTVPTVQQTVTIDGVDYYVDRREDGQGGIGVTFMCKRV